MEPSQFCFFVVNPGSEPFLKAELALRYPFLNLAFSRPGLLTFKSRDASQLTPAVLNEPIFARLGGYSFRRVNTVVERQAALEELRALLPGSSVVHTFARLPEAPDALSRDLAQEQPVPGQWVIDQIEIEPSQWLIGHHCHQAHLLTTPGNRFLAPLPSEAPSRAYTKLQEALIWSDAFQILRPRDTALEIGSAPGGATYYLLQQNINVIGVDPAAMDPICTAFAGPAFCLHLNKQVQRLTRADLHQHPVHLITLDMNVRPPVALNALEKVVRMTAANGDLKMAVVTLKMGSVALVGALAQYMARIRELGFSQVKATQLSSNHQEIVVVAIK